MQLASGFIQLVAAGRNRNIVHLQFHCPFVGDKSFCYMTGENPVSLLAQFVFINLYVYLETGLNRSTS